MGEWHRVDRRRQNKKSGGGGGPPTQTMGGPWRPATSGSGPTVAPPWARPAGHAELLDSLASILHRGMSWSGRQPRERAWEKGGAGQPGSALRCWACSCWSWDAKARRCTNAGCSKAGPVGHRGTASTSKAAKGAATGAGRKWDLPPEIESFVKQEPAPPKEEPPSPGDDPAATPPAPPASASAAREGAAGGAAATNDDQLEALRQAKELLAKVPAAAAQLSSVSKLLGQAATPQKTSARKAFDVASRHLSKLQEAVEKQEAAVNKAKEALEAQEAELGLVRQQHARALEAQQGALQAVNLEFAAPGSAGDALPAGGAQRGPSTSSRPSWTAGGR